MTTNRRKPYPEVARDRINTGILLNRLQNHVVGKVKMSNTQVQAAKVLLNKTLPDLQAMQLTGAGGKDLIPPPAQGVDWLGYPIAKPDEAGKPV
jgi:hypothetical protein